MKAPALLLALLLTGCSIIYDEEVPPFTLDGLWRGTDANLVTWSVRFEPPWGRRDVNGTYQARPGGEGVFAGEWSSTMSLGFDYPEGEGEGVWCWFHGEMPHIDPNSFTGTIYCGEGGKPYDLTLERRP